MNNVTVIIVSYNTYQLMRECYNSLRKFYPTIPCILIDGSDENDKCHEFVKTRNLQYNKIFSLKKNYGHGPGMALGIKNCETEYFLLMDSDVVIKRPVLGVMLRLFETLDIYGVGNVIKVNKYGLNDPKGYDYLHPHFALIKKSEYLRFAPIIHHGAPMIKAMMSGADHGVYNMDLSEYIVHHERGTRKLNPKAFHPKFWDKS